MTVLGIDAHSPRLAEADHLALTLVARLGLGDPAVVCTHLIRGESPHIALSLDLPVVPTSLVEMARAGEFSLAVGSDTYGPAAGAVAAVEAYTARTSGRAVVFPGSSTLTRSVPVATVLTTAVSAITVLAGGEPPAITDIIHTRDHVRPEWHAGVLTLTVSPVKPGEYAPFEVPNPTPCCADHG